ncbi:MAG: flagellar biosynthesis protein FlhA, partial [Pseudomonadota bacterium]
MSMMSLPNGTSINRAHLAGLGTPVLVLIMLGLMMLPLPPVALDVLFTFNIALSLLILLAGIYTLRPLDFAVFPTVLLVATLLRLALNVASTRVVLLRGHEGTGAAGNVIEAFGNFVIGGNYAVGLIVFVILIIINFVVVTKGAGRISEVTARFTLDAMPGKQMAIDADLNAGAITQAEAKHRREEIGRESDFYGAMDGASKFVKGDAIAGILILLINIVGGFAIGILYHNLDASQAAEYYVLLTIGDGLVAQVPSLLLSAATAILVTRVSDAQDIGSQISGQLLSSPKGLLVAGGVLFVLGVIPGMPNIVFLLLAFGLLGWGTWLSQRPDDPQSEVSDEKSEDTEQADLGWQDVPSVDIIGLEVGYQLIELADNKQGGQLLASIRNIRRRVSEQMGFLIPIVHIKDNIGLDANQYRITLQDVLIGEGTVYTNRLMVIDPSGASIDLAGIAAKEPMYGAEAVWIDPMLRDEAMAKRYEPVDAVTVIATHLNHLLNVHAHELLGHDEVQQLLDILSRTSPRLVEHLDKDLSLGVVTRVLQNLLEEQVPVRDMRTIAEALAEHAGRSQEPDVLTAQVRIALGRAIFQNINGLEEELPVITLDSKLEQLLLQTLTGTEQTGVEPGLAEMMMSQIAGAISDAESQGRPAVLLVGTPVRQWISRLVRASHPTAHIMSYEELPAARKVSVVATVGGS